MNVEERDFRQRYAELSDEGLLLIDREDLVELARQCYDQELAKRGLEAQSELGEEPAAAQDELASAAAPPISKLLPKLLRLAIDVSLNLLAAAIGTAIAEEEFYHFFHPTTLQGAYRKELLLSGAVAFVLGSVAFLKWRSTASQWIWVLGLVGFAWRIALGAAPRDAPTESLMASLVFVSLRMVTYSAGAWCCAGLIKSRTLPFEQNKPTGEP